jgi:hypothetical protein
MASIDVESVARRFAPRIPCLGSDGACVLAQPRRTNAPPAQASARPMRREARNAVGIEA